MEPPSNVKLSAEASADANAMHVRYTLQNASGQDVYVLNGQVVVDRASRTASVSTTRYSLFASGPDEATVVVGVPRLPVKKTVTQRIVPLGIKLAAGATLKQDLDPIPLPLAEESPYATLEEERDMTSVPIHRVWLAVHFVPASTPGLVIESVDYDTRYVEVRPPNPGTDVKEARVSLMQKDATLRILPTSR